MWLGDKSGDTCISDGDRGDSGDGNADNCGDGCGGITGVPVAGVELIKVGASSCRDGCGSITGVVAGAGSLASSELSPKHSFRCLFCRTETETKSLDHC